jgi:hypothetical protein
MLRDDECARMAASFGPAPAEREAQQPWETSVLFLKGGLAEPRHALRQL